MSKDFILSSVMSPAAMEVDQGASSLPLRKNVLFVSYEHVAGGPARFSRTLSTEQSSALTGIYELTVKNFNINSKGTIAEPAYLSCPQIGNISRNRVLLANDTAASESASTKPVIASAWVTSTDVCSSVPTTFTLTAPTDLWEATFEVYDKSYNLWQMGAGDMLHFTIEFVRFSS